MRIRTEDIICRAEINCKTSKYPIHIFIIGYMLTRFFDNSLVNDIYIIGGTAHTVPKIHGLAGKTLCIRVTTAFRISFSFSVFLL